MTIFSHFPCAEQQSEAQIRGGQGRRTQGLISPSARWHLKLDGRVELERLEGRVQALYSVRVTAGRGGGGRMLQGERGKEIASDPNDLCSLHETFFGALPLYPST